MDIPRPDVPAEANELAALRDQQRYFQNLLLVTLVALIIMSAGVALFIAKQMRMIQQQLAEQRPAVQKLAADYQRGSEPLIRNFSTAMAQFASTNQNFRPIFEKYRPTLSNYIGAPLPPARPGAAAGTNP